MDIVGGRSRVIGTIRGSSSRQAPGVIAAVCLISAWDCGVSWFTQTALVL